jgi:hypothetical protein
MSIDPNILTVSAFHICCRIIQVTDPMSLVDISKGLINEYINRRGTGCRGEESAPFSQTFDFRARDGQRHAMCQDNFDRDHERRCFAPGFSRAAS